MTKADILKELNLDDSYEIHEYIETEKCVYVIAHNIIIPEGEFINYTPGEYAKWKRNNKWFTPNCYTDNDLYIEINGKKSMLDTLQ